MLSSIQWTKQCHSSGTQANLRFPSDLPSSVVLLYYRKTWNTKNLHLWECYYRAINSCLPASIESKPCLDKREKHCTRSDVSKPITSHCGWVSLATFLPTLLTSLPPLYAVKSATPHSNNPWPTGSRHNGLKITPPLATTAHPSAQCALIQHYNTPTIQSQT